MRLDRLAVINHRPSWLIACAACVGIALTFSGRPAMAIPSQCDALSGNLVTNCGFETGDLSGWTHTGNLGFTSISGDPDFVHSGTFGLDEGPVGSDGFISQTLTTTPGQTYDISVWYDPSGQTPSDFDIQWNNATLLDLTDVSTGYTQLGLPDWLDETATAVGTGSDLLTISFRDDPNFSGIDDISVVAATSSVPEPTSLAIMGAALVGFAAIRRKRKAA